MSFEQLTVLNLKPGVVCENLPPQSIIIHTCQRTIVAGFSSHLKHDPYQEIYYGASAYKFLLEVICGLRSKILAEYEIVSQFKGAYHHYLSLPLIEKNGNLIKVIEKLFKDSKEIRTKYLLGISHESYAGITKKVIKSNFKSSDQVPQITILGSGKLAEDIIKNCSKSYRIHLVARNKNRLQNLKELYGIEYTELGAIQEIAKHPCLINTIGSNEVLFTDFNFFNSWKTINAQRFFLDLGSPSSIDTKLNMDDSVMLLSDFFKFSEIIGQEKKQKIELAKIAIEAIVKKRDLLFNKSWINWEFSPRLIMAN